jgi:dTDP-4-amino-4,6-dideoxygalactose transaminase
MTEFFDLRSVNNASKSELTAAFNRVLESGLYVLGNEVNRFESEFANYCEVGIALQSEIVLMHCNLFYRA